MHMVREEVQFDQLMFNSTINLGGTNKSYKYKLRFCVLKIMYKRKDMEQDIIQEKQSVEQFYHIIHINAMTYSNFGS